MRRLQLVELEDLPWCPPTLRAAATDYLQLVLHLANPYASILPRLQHALAQSKTDTIIDLGAGSGGPWTRLLPALACSQPDIMIHLTDRYPNRAAWRRLQLRFPRHIVPHADPVDATAVPSSMRGFRTLFSTFHHFPPATARAVLADAVRRRQGMGVFEYTQRRPLALAGMLLTPLLVQLTTPLIRPLRWSRLVWTYLVPAVPLLVVFDGLVSCLRTYTVAELHALTGDLADDYHWEIGEQPVTGSIIPVTYLIGYPRG